MPASAETIIFPASSMPQLSAYLARPAGRTLDQVLDKYSIPHDIKLYPGAKHSFFNAGRNHNVEAAHDSWGRVLAFFEQQIGSRQ